MYTKNTAFLLDEGVSLSTVSPFMFSDRTECFTAVSLGPRSPSTTASVDPVFTPLEPGRNDDAYRSYHVNPRTTSARTGMIRRASAILRTPERSLVVVEGTFQNYARYLGILNITVLTVEVRSSQRGTDIH